MNLFWKNLLGGITPTAKLEQSEAELISAFKRYEEVGKSLELVEYKKLFHVVKSPEFIENKKTLQNRKYKDTEEYRDAAKFKKLDNMQPIKLYYQVLGSKELKEYLEFKKSPEFEELGDKAKVKASEKLQKLKAFEHSKAYKTYSRFHESYIIKEYEQLKTLVQTPDFKTKNEFWANPNRWQSTDDFKTEQRFYELAKNPDIAFYVKEDSARFEKISKLNETFREEFNWNTLDKSRWNFGFSYKSPKLIGNHSFANENQANNSGKNVSVVNGILNISTKAETVKAAAWHTTKGFIEKEFKFTADVLQTATHFRQKRGEFSAKIKCTGNVHHAFWLGTDEKLPHINVFLFDGKKIKVGNANKNIIDGVEITGLNPSQFYIYKLVWTEKELVWYINNFEVYRTASNIPNQEMYLAFSSFIPEKQRGSAGNLEVDWVKVAQK